MSAYVDPMTSILLMWLGTASGAGGPWTVGPSEDSETLAEALMIGQTDILLRAGAHVGGGTIWRDGTHLTGEPDAILMGGPAVQLEIVSVSNIVVENIEFDRDPSGASELALSVIDSFGVQLTDLDIHDCTVSTPFLGGAVFADNSELTISGSTFANNEATAGGALYAQGNSQVTVVSSTFDNNQAMVDGGAIYASNSDLYVTDSHFTGNETDGYGGAIATFDATALELVDSTFASNSAARGMGSAVDALASSGPVALTGLTVTDQRLTPAISLEANLEVALDRVTLDNNAAGGVYAVGNTSVQVSDTWFCSGGPVAASHFALIDCQGECWVKESVFADAAASLGAAGLDASGALGAFTVEDSLFLGLSGPNGSAMRFAGLTGPLTLHRLLVGDSTGSPAIHVGDGPPLDLEDIATFGNTAGDGSGALDTMQSAFTAVTRPVLTQAVDRCPSTFVELACDPANDPVFALQAGPSFVDDDLDDVPQACDCDDGDPLLRWDCDDEPTEPTEPTQPGTGSIPTEPVDPASEPPAPGTFLLGGGGCSHVARPAHWPQQGPWALLARRAARIAPAGG